MRRVLSPFLVILVLLLTSCSGLGGRGSSLESIHIGTRGVTLTFENVPQKTFAGDAFSLSGYLTNEGTMDVDNGIITLGIEDDLVTMEGPRQLPLRLFGRSALQPVGESVPLRLTLETRQLPAMAQEARTNILITMCYPYQTQASATLCIDPAPERKDIKKPCTMKNVGMGGGQGAPIGISSIAVTMLDHQDKSRVVPLVAITLDNLADGQTIEPERIGDACAGRASGSLNKVAVRAYLADQQLTCGREGEDAIASLQKKQNTVRCKLPEGIDINRGAYSSVLRVEADYGYIQSESRTITIVRDRPNV